MILSFKEIRGIIKSGKATNHSIKVSVLSDSSSQFFVTGLKGYGMVEDLGLDIYEADYDQVTQEIFNQQSSFHQRDNEVAIILFCTEKLIDKFYKLPIEARENFAEEQVAYFKELVSCIPEKCKIIFNTFPRITASIFCNYSSKVNSSFDFQLSKLNLGIKTIGIECKNVFICDIESLQNLVGIEKRIDIKFYIKGNVAYSLEFIPLLVKNYIDIIKSIKGIKLKKCLILDLDNTMWGGIIGDDGMEGIQIGSLGIGKAFDNLQRWAKELKNRGIILCICSKNTEHIAKEPFEKHPDMILRLDDISVFVANWENKADNIRYIKEVLNIGFDSMVFLDDNPFERNLVKQEIPEVYVPDLPKDPVEYLNFIKKLNLFETASYSGEDSNRTKRYQEEAKRIGTKQSFRSIDEYLNSLDMKGTIKPFNNFSIPRVSQLTQRSNQFNLRTIRYSERDIKFFIEDKNYLTFQVSLEDKFGDYGVISLVIGKKEDSRLFIDTWIMSCRVLKRGVEKFVLNELVKQAKEQEVQEIIGEYLPTKKNGIVKDHYQDLGFKLKKDQWVLDVSSFQSSKCYINNSKSSSII